MRLTCIYCNKEYDQPEGNWLKDGSVGKRQGSVPSNLYCSYHCGRTHSALKRKQTVGSNYSPFNDPATRKKAQSTIKAKYGVDNAFESPVIKEKIKNTLLDKYGVDNIAKDRDTQEKIKETNLARYGTVSPLSSLTVREKIKQTNLERYATEHPQTLQETKNKAKQTNLSRYGTFNPLGNKEIQQKASNTIQERYGYEWNCLRPEAINNSNKIISQTNIKWKTVIESLNIPVTLEYDRWDLYLPTLDLYIDINPTITHQSTKPFITHFGTIKPKTPLYHINKLKPNAIMIWDWDNQQDILPYLLTPYIPKENTITIPTDKIKLYNITNYTVINQTQPILHTFNPKTKQHVINPMNVQELLDSGSLEVYDCGNTTFTLK